MLLRQSSNNYQKYSKIKASEDFSEAFFQVRARLIANGFYVLKYATRIERHNKQILTSNNV